MSKTRSPDQGLSPVVLDDRILWRVHTVVKKDLAVCLGIYETRADACEAYSLYKQEGILSDKFVDCEREAFRPHCDSGIRRVNHVKIAKRRNEMRRKRLREQDVQVREDSSQEGVWTRVRDPDEKPYEYRAKPRKNSRSNPVVAALRDG